MVAGRTAAGHRMRVPEEPALHSSAGFVVS